MHAWVAGCTQCSCSGIVKHSGYGQCHHNWRSLKLITITHACACRVSGADSGVRKGGFAIPPTFLIMTY